MVKKTKKVEKEEDSGMDLDDAFGDDEDVEYAESKPRDVNPKKKKEEKKEDDGEKVILKGSKPISEIKKGDKIKVDGVEMEVDAHYVLIDHGNTKEMAIEMFDPKKDEDYQLRYFSDNLENSLEFYELDEIVYNKKPVKKVEW